MFVYIKEAPKSSDNMQKHTYLYFYSGQRTSGKYIGILSYYVL